MLIVLSLAAFVAGLSGIYIGYDLSIINGFLIQPAAKAYFNWTSDTQRGFIASSFVLGGLVGSLFSSWFSDKLGRRRGIILASIVFIIGGAIQTAATQLSMIYVGRVISGLAVGVTLAVVPTYTSEIAPRRLRGVLMFVSSICIGFGFMFGNVVNYLVLDMQGTAGFRILFGVQIIPAVLTIVGLLFMPSSPRWQMMCHDTVGARQSMARLYNLPEDHVKINKELREIADAMMQEEKSSSTFCQQLAVPSIRYRFLIVTILGSLLPLCGKTALSYYTPDIFKMAGFTSVSTQLLILIAIGGTTKIFTLLGFVLVDRLGRRMLMMIGGALLSGSMYAIGIPLLSMQGEMGPSSASYGVVVMIFVFYSAYTATWAPITWIYVAELLPQHARGNAMALSTTANWLFDFIISQITPTLLTLLGGRFLIIQATITLVGIAWMYCVLLETKNKSLEAIDKEFRS